MCLIHVRCQTYTYIAYLRLNQLNSYKIIYCEFFGWIFHQLKTTCNPDITYVHITKIINMKYKMIVTCNTYRGRIFRRNNRINLLCMRRIVHQSSYEFDTLLSYLYTLRWRRRSRFHNAWCSPTVYSHLLFSYQMMDRLLCHIFDEGILFKWMSTIVRYIF